LEETFLSASDSGNPPDKKSPFSIRNVRLFIAFRVCFNARFYYPVFAILFLDFGLTLDQFALLNAAWAATIVLMEVPSGALADTIGRRKLLVVAGILMVIEMALLCFVPLGNVSLLFGVFIVNRVLSGIAEAAASGADEAIAYDSLKQEGNAGDWPRVIEAQMRMQSMAYIGAMSLGAAVYDPILMQRFMNLLGLQVNLTQDITLRFPLYLSFIMAILTLLATMRMQEDNSPSDPAYQPAQNRVPTIWQAFRLTLQAGNWILKTPFALVIILAGLMFDHCLRMFGTMNSQYYRLIDLPEASFGLISSALAVLGLIIPRLAYRMVHRHPPIFNLGVITAISMIGLIGVTFFWPIFGLLPAVLLRVVMYMVMFFQSHYLNRITASHQRATVLSFKGLSFNLAYGLIGILYAVLLATLHPRVAAAHPDLTGIVLENTVFMQSISWFPWYFLVTVALLFVIARWQLKDTDVHKRVG
jgi:MFS family permease